MDNKKFKDLINERDKERIEYNEKHGTHFSYGQYFAYKNNGLLRYMTSKEKL